MAVQDEFGVHFLAHPHIWRHHALPMLPSDADKQIRRAFNK
jgi:hypothetical protein